MKNINIQNVEIISNYTMDENNNININKLFLPTTYEIIKNKKLNIFKKYKYKKLLFKNILLNNIEDYNFLVTTKEIIALKKKKQKSKHNLYLIEKLKLSKYLKKEEIFIINNKYKIWKKDNIFLELKLEKKDLKNIKTNINYNIKEDEKINNYMLIFQNLNTNVQIKNIFSSEIKILSSLILLNISFFNIYEIYKTKIIQNKLQQKLKELNIKNSFLYIENELEKLNTLKKQYEKNFIKISSKK